MDHTSQAFEAEYGPPLRRIFAALLAFILALALISGRAMRVRAESDRNLSRSDQALGELAAIETAGAIQLAYEQQQSTSGDSSTEPAAARIASALDALDGSMVRDPQTLALLGSLREDIAAPQPEEAARLRADLGRLGALMRTQHRELRLQDRSSDHQADLLSEAAIGAMFVLVLISYAAVSSEFRRRRRVIESLRASEALLLANFEQSGVGIAHIGHDRRILRANRRLGVMLEALPHDLVGVSILDLSYPGGGEWLAAERERIFAGTLEHAVGVQRYLRRGGTVFWARVTISVARSWAGIPQYEIAVFEDVTGERHARSQAGRLRVALEMSFDAVYVVSHPDMTILDTNDAACRMLGYRREELVGADARLILASGGRACPALAAEDGKSAGSPAYSTRESVHQRKDGTLVPVEIQRGQVAIRGARYLVCVVRDISERKCAERARAFEHAVTRCIAGLALGESGSRINTLIRSICECEESEAGFYLSLDESAEMLCGRECWCAPELATRIQGLQELTCHPGGGLGGRAWETGEPCWIADLRGDRDGAAARGLIDAGLRSAFTFPVLAEGQVLGVIALVGRAVRAPDKHLIEAARSAGAQIGQFLERSHARQRLAYMAQFDAVTGLPNRSLFRDRLEQVLAQGRRYQKRFALLFLDLDEFKRVNDTLGHAVGDELLRQVAGRLVACARAGDTVARLGGDEFAFVLSDLDSPEGASTVAQQLLDALKAPFALAGREVYVSASVGITVQPPDGGDAETLLRNADTAMYRAKHAGRNGFRFFTAEMDIEAKRRLELEKDLRGAIERNEFELYYQPKCEVNGNFVTGAEALLRWRRRDGTLMPPADFIPVLEDTGLIAEVGDWVLREACRQHTAWHLAGHGQVPIAVNVSQRQFVGGKLVERVSAALATGGCAARFLEIEITESMVMHDVEVTVQPLQALRAAGVRIAVDDFGTGYSSFAYLRRLPIDVLKIDRSFIKDVNGNANDATITTAIIGMARNLGYRLVAEGVETPLQRQFLEANGCHEIQGYLLSRPLPAAEFARWLAANEARTLRNPDMREQPGHDFDH